MKLMSLVAENFKKLKLVQLDFDESGVVKISGKNKQGKSTILESLWVALGGATETPEHPIRNGEERAEIKLTFDDIVVRRVITENSNRLIVTDIEGNKVSSPQTLLNSLVTKIGLRPRAFVDADKDKQVEMLLEVINLDFDKDNLEDITGGIIEEGKNPIETIDKTYDKVYQNRREVNVNLRNTKGNYESYSDVEKTEPVSVSDLIDKKEKLNKDISQFETREEIIEQERENELKMKDRCDEIKAEIERLKVELKEQQEKYEEQKERCDSFEQGIEDDREDIEEKREKVSEINNRLKEVDEINDKAQKWKEKKKAKEKMEQLEEKSNVFTNTLEMIDNYKEELLAWAKFPIKGLSFKNGEVWYNEAPLTQASKTEKLEVGFAIMTALNPELKVVLIDDGNTIDSENLEFLEDLANNEEYIVLMEYMDEDAETGIVIEDGEVVKDYYNDPFGEKANKSA